MEEKKGLNKEEFFENLKKLDLDSIELPDELPEELLEKVAGGSVFKGDLDDWDMDYLDACITDYKAYGVDLETTLRYMLKSNFSNEALWYVGTHW